MNLLNTVKEAHSGGNVTLSSRKFNLDMTSLIMSTLAYSSTNPLRLSPPFPVRFITLEAPKEAPSFSIPRSRGGFVAGLEEYMH